MTPPPLAALLERLTELERNARPPPWKASGSCIETEPGSGVYEIGCTGPRVWISARDAAFIAALRNAAPRLLALVEAGAALADACRKPALHKLAITLKPDLVPAFPQLVAALAAFDRAAAGEGT